MAKDNSHDKHGNSSSKPDTSKHNKPRPCINENKEDPKPRPRVVSEVAEVRHKEGHANKDNERSSK